MEKCIHFIGFRNLFLIILQDQLQYEPFKCDAEGECCEYHGGQKTNQYLYTSGDTAEHRLLTVMYECSLKFFDDIARLDNMTKLTV